MSDTLCSVSTPPVRRQRMWQHAILAQTQAGRCTIHALTPW
ncbi:MAG: hypothetical protein U1F04_12880 [Burkholderiaceae bacterium]